MPNDPILHLLGVARKARLLEIGEEPVGAVCRARHARLVLLAQDAAPNTRRRCAHFGEAGNVLWLELPFTKEELGFHLGRGSCAMLALTDAGMAAAVADKLALRDPERYGPAAQQLREKADRTLQRQKERRQHEKNLRQGKHKPWAPPPEPKKSEPSGTRPPKSPAKPKPPRPGAAARHGKDGPGRPAHPPKSGPGTRRLTGKFRHNP
ncbi:50S ribosomal protein L7 [Pseudoflavonifractor sp. AF19-9AC]|uniref:L7Ae/L30e/S12e/Gadd45 family ribosomal protein n=1 Tax=Pseudoflavonifractor sp. AF19-9AC TaxID=2292244 RepID=UPI000E4E90F7|nr:50S ribosomal protein L7 [Pseudoflavonifractor sp. AF19-9AC]RHR11118.1 50S ribosomal protein L7 [Pseudoflavonifractor sp. AF19-9AC]